MTSSEERKVKNRAVHCMLNRLHSFVILSKVYLFNLFYRQADRLQDMTTFQYSYDN